MYFLLHIFIGGIVLKKVSLFIGSLLLCVQTFSMTLDDLIVQLEKNGYSTQYRELEKKQLSIDYKEVDRITGLFWGWMTIGQILSILMIVISLILWKVRKKIF